MTRFRRGIRQRRMTKEWISFYTYIGTPSTPHSVTMPAGTDASLWIIPPGDVLSLFDEPTILRMIISLTFGTEGLNGGNSMSLAFGIITARGIDEIGTPPVYNALQQGYWDWLWTYYPQVTTNNGGGISGTYGSTEPASVQDVRSKRKVKPGEGILFSFANNNGSDADAAMQVQGRILLAHA